MAKSERERRDTASGMDPDAAQSGEFTIDVDTGGTFTDCYVAGDGRIVRAKADTTPHDLSHGVMACIDQAAEALALGRRELLRRSHTVRLSTTVATNTLINRNGAKVGLLAGARLGGRIKELADGLPLNSERIAFIPEDGHSDDIDQVRRATRGLLERGARILVVALSGAADLPRRENAVRQIIARDYPRHYLGAVPVLPSHQVTPIEDAITRIQTAVLDAYLHPVMSRFLYRVEDQLRRDGYERPLQIGNANGGTSRVAKTAALRTWGSGPAGGIAGAAVMARRLDLARVAAVDIGGTSTDIGIIVSGRWESDVEPVIEGVRVSLPTLDVRSAGVGCGSVVRVEDGRIRVGPESAGAQPGPAAFGLGGGEATVTDAVCCLGKFDPANFLGGRRSLDLEAARRVVEEKVAAPLGLDLVTAAALILERTTAQIADAVAGRLRARSLDPAGCTLFATGGGGGILGYAIGRHLGMAAVYAFPVSPVFSAFGQSQLHVMHTYETLSGEVEVAEAIAGLRRAALLDMRGEGFDAGDVSFRWQAEVVDGEGIALHDLDGDEARAVEAIRAHGSALRLVRMTASAPGRAAALPTVDAACDKAARREPRPISWPGREEPTCVFEWTALPQGFEIAGPAVLETTETTLVVPPDALGTIGAMGEVKMVPREPAGDRGGER